MKKIAIFFLLLLASVSLIAPCHAAQSKARNQAAANEVRTDYFSIRIPPGWKMPKPLKKQPHNGISAVFTPDNNSLAVTLNIIHANENAAIIAAHTAKNIDQTGFKTSEPVENNGIWEFSISGKANGHAWFGSNGKICAITLMFGSDFAQANAILKALQPVDKGLFPESVN